MIAVVGIPGSRHHTYRHFARTERAEAEAWIEETYRRILDASPSVGSIPTDLIPDREAAQIRYADGTRVYKF